jgi:hypothetical protein
LLEKVFRDNPSVPPPEPDLSAFLGHRTGPRPLTVQLGLLPGTEPTGNAADRLRRGGGSEPVVTVVAVDVRLLDRIHHER